MLKIAYYSLDDPRFACPQLRMYGPAAHSGGALSLRPGVRLDGGRAQIDMSLLAWCDLFVVQRGFPGKAAFESGFVGHLQKTGKPIVYETDDDYAALPPWLEKPYQAHDLAHLARFIALASLVTVTTETLRAALAPLNRRIAVLPNCLDDRLWPLAPPAPRGDGTVRILFTGSKGHWKDLETIEPALRNVLESRPQAELLLMGVKDTGLAGHPRLRVLPYDGRYETWPARLAAAGADIAVVPLVDHPFNRAKSNIKFLDFAAVGVPGIYQDLPPYDSVTDGVDGLKATTVESWQAALLRLIDDAALRRLLAAGAMATLREKYLLSRNAPRWVEAYGSLLGLRP